MVKKFPDANHIDIKSDEGYFICNEIPVLCHIDMNSKRHIPVAHVGLSDGFNRGLYHICKRSGDYVFCFPDWGNSIYVWSLVEDQSYNILIEGGETGVFSDAYEFEGKIYVHAVKRKSVISINNTPPFNLNEYSYETDSNYEGVMYSSADINKGLLYLPMGEKGSIVTFDMHDHSFIRVKMEGLDDIVTLTYFSENRLFISLRNNHFVYLCSTNYPDFSIEKTIPIEKLPYENIGETCIEKMIYRNNKLWIISSVLNYIFVYDFISGELNKSVVDMNNRYAKYDGRNAYYLFLYHYGNKLGVLSRENYSVYEYDMDNGEKKEIVYTTDSRSYSKIYGQGFLKNEDAYFTISDFLSLINDDEVLI